MQPRTKPVKTHLKKTIFSYNPEKKKKNGNRRQVNVRFPPPPIQCCLA